VALAIFLITYVFIAGSRLPGLRLDRPGGALAGAAAMVAARVVSPLEARAAVDADTIVLLFGMMIISAYLTRAGFFRAVAWQALKLAGTPRTLLVALVLVSGALSAFLVNDTVCLMLTPLVLSLAEAAELPPTPYLLALCMASNAGSVATFTGNPQNMLIGLSSGIAYGRFAIFMAAPALVSTLCIAVVLLFTFRRVLPRAPLATKGPPPPMNRSLLALCLAVVVGVVTAFFLGFSMAASALVGAAALMIIARQPPRDIMERVDYVLLVFFASLFIVVYGVNKEGWAEAMRTTAGPLFENAWGFSAVTLVASNVFSNVPFVMLARHWVPQMHDPFFMWLVLALASTLAGNLTLVGSVANLIVFEGARGKTELGFWGYLKVGGPATLLSLLLGLLVLLAERSFIAG
jgi:Na+/H+ antiporter NhaD/arsenite permease-like protein